MFGFRRPRPDASDGQLDQLVDGGRRPDAQEPIAGTCDRCPAAAVVRVRLPSTSVLMLCGHHGRRYARALLVQGAVVTGELAFAATPGLPVPAGTG